MFWPTIPVLPKHSATAFKKLALTAGMDHFLTKPIEKSEMTAILTLLD